MTIAAGYQIEDHDEQVLGDGAKDSQGDVGFVIGIRPLPVISLGAVTVTEWAPARSVGRGPDRVGRHVAWRRTLAEVYRPGATAPGASVRAYLGAEGARWAHRKRWRSASGCA